jgi:hypothetical protein
MTVPGDITKLKAPQLLVFLAFKDVRRLVQVKFPAQNVFQVITCQTQNLTSHVSIAHPDGCKKHPLARVASSVWWVHINFFQLKKNVNCVRMVMCNLRQHNKGASSVLLVLAKEIKNKLYATHGECFLLLFFPTIFLLHSLSPK